MTEPLKYKMEYGILRGVAALVCALPYRAALLFGWLLARISYPLAKKKIVTAEQRVRQVFGDTKSDREVKRIVWIAWRNLAFSAVEMIRTPRHDLNWVKRVTINYQAFDKLVEPARKGGNVILCLPHMGSWDVGGVSCARFGIPFMAIVKNQKNKRTSEYLNRMRSYTGQTVLDRDDPKLMRTVLKGMSEGKVLVVLPDIRARNGGIRVPFLNGTAVVNTGAAMFARHSGYPILPGITLREGWRQHRWLTFDYVYPDASLSKEEDVERMTKHIMGLFSEVILQHPEQYFWFNKKWLLEEE
ncbi:MAG: hypothetical protein EOM20_11790 [Spartobacteria bacterium]|nr:hypothetical protein [Spartobacteria bacterium]